MRRFRLHIFWHTFYKYLIRAALINFHGQLIQKIELHIKRSTITHIVVTGFTFARICSVVVYAVGVRGTLYIDVVFGTFVQVLNKKVTRNRKQYSCAGVTDTKRTNAIVDETRIFVTGRAITHLERMNTQWRAAHLFRWASLAFAKVDSQKNIS